MLNLWKNGDYASFEPMVSISGREGLYAFAGKTVYLVVDNTTDREHAKEVKTNYSISYTQYVSKR
jgi:hypothetical protein